MARGPSCSAAGLRWRRLDSTSTARRGDLTASSGSRRHVQRRRSACVSHSRASWALWARCHDREPPARRRKNSRWGAPGNIQNNLSMALQLRDDANDSAASATVEEIAEATVSSPQSTNQQWIVTARSRSWAMSKPWGQRGGGWPRMLARRLCCVSCAHGTRAEPALVDRHARRGATPHRQNMPAGHHALLEAPQPLISLGVGAFGGLSLRQVSPPGCRSLGPGAAEPGASRGRGLLKPPSTSARRQLVFEPAARNGDEPQLHRSWTRAGGTGARASRGRLQQLNSPRGFETEDLRTLGHARVRRVTLAPLPSRPRQECFSRRTGGARGPGALQRRDDV